MWSTPCKLDSTVGVKVSSLSFVLVLYNTYSAIELFSIHTTDRLNMCSVISTS